MTGREKLFFYYKAGWSVKIVPRNAAGWGAMALWIASLLPIIGLLHWLLSLEPALHWLVPIIAGFAALLGTWTFAMMRWMKARSEVVDIAELMALKKESDSKRRGRSSKR